MRAANLSRSPAPSSGAVSAVPAWPEPTLAVAAELFRALSDRGRLRTLAALTSGERSVGDLAVASGDGLSTVSQRLKVLQASGLVSRRRQGKQVFYRLADHHVVELLGNALAHAAEARHHPPAPRRATAPSP